MLSAIPSQQMNFSKEKMLVFYVEDNIQLIINRHSNSIAFAYLFDKEIKKIIAIPEEFVVYDLTNKCILDKNSNNSQMFALCWSDNYIFTYKSQEIANIQNVRLWDIRSERFT